MDISTLTVLSSLNITTMPRPNWDMPMFWDYVKWFLSINQQWIMIAVAVTFAGFILMVIVNLFVKAANPDADKDDEDYDIREI